MLEELRLNPRSPEARSASRVLGERALTEVDQLDPGLSTGFPEGHEGRSTGAWGSEKEEVG